MRIGIAGLISLELLTYPSGVPLGLPIGYPAPITASFVNRLLKRGHDVVACA